MKGGVAADPVAVEEEEAVPPAPNGSTLVPEAADVEVVTLEGDCSAAAAVRTTWLVTRYDTGYCSDVTSAVPVNKLRHVVYTSRNDERRTTNDERRTEGCLW